MKKNIAFEKSFNIILLFFLGAGIVSWILYFKQYQQKDTVDIHLFPGTFNGWTAEEVTITEDEYAILETKNVFVRKYTNPEGKQVYLFIVYSQNNRKVSHPPEICYTGGGASILGTTREKIEIKDPPVVIEANNLDLVIGPVKHQSFYWFKVGSSFTPNYWKQQMLIAIKTLTGQSSSSALIRVSTDVVGQDVNAAKNTIKDFVKEIFPSILKYLP